MTPVTVQRTVHYDTAWRMALRAVEAGATLLLSDDGKRIRRLDWDISADCQSPLAMRIIGRSSRDQPSERMARKLAATPLFRSMYAEKTPIFLDMEVKCRHCDACRNHKRRLWTGRAIGETRQASRTWFVTYTLNPQARAYYQLQAARNAVIAHRWDPETGKRVPYQRKGVDYDAFPEAERWDRLCKEIYGDFQRMFKRLRKGFSIPRKGSEPLEVPPAVLRYLVVPEQHEDGQPHFHALIHEVPGRIGTSERALRHAWARFTDEGKRVPLGFVKAVLVQTETDNALRSGVGYVCKYVTKDGGRPRASGRYGQIAAEPEGEQLRPGSAHRSVF